MNQLSVVVTVKVCTHSLTHCLVTLGVTIHHSSVWLSDVFQMVYDLDGTRYNTYAVWRVGKLDIHVAFVVECHVNVASL